MYFCLSGTNVEDLAWRGWSDGWMDGAPASQRPQIQPFIFGQSANKTGQQTASFRGALAKIGKDNFFCVLSRIKKIVPRWYFLSIVEWYCVQMTIISGSELRVDIIWQNDQRQPGSGDQWPGYEPKNTTVQMDVIMQDKYVHKCHLFSSTRYLWLICYLSGRNILLVPYTYSVWLINNNKYSTSLWVFAGTVFCSSVNTFTAKQNGGSRG